MNVNSTNQNAVRKVFTFYENDQYSPGFMIANICYFNNQSLS